MIISRILIGGTVAIIASVLTAAFVLAADATTLPPTPRAQPTYTCGPQVPASKASAVLVPLRDGTYRIYADRKTVTLQRSLKPAGAVWCVAPSKG